MRIFLKQSFRGLLAILMGLAAFTFMLIILFESYLYTTGPYEAALSQGIVATQKANIDEAIDTLAKKNRFDGEPIKPLVTQENLMDYNLAIVSWWQNGLTKDNWTEAPSFDGALLAPGFESQEKLDDRKRQSSNVLTQKLIQAEVMNANENTIINMFGSVSVVKYLELLPYLKAGLLGVFTLCLVLLILSTLKQFSLMLWFLGLAAFLFGGLFLGANHLIQSLDIAANVGAYNESFKTILASILAHLQGILNNTGLVCLAGAVASMVVYAIIFTVLRKIKTMVNA